MPDVIRTILVEQKMMYEEKIAQLIKERDEARREVCRMAAGKEGKSSAVSPGAVEHAKFRNWDCFEEQK